MTIPNHIAIIMDGNGRWAKARGLPRTEGHKKGLETAQLIIDHAANVGVKYLSLYVFSTENWKRPKAEVSALFALADKYVSDFEKFCKDRIRVVVSGNPNRIPAATWKKLCDIQQKTAQFSAICVNLCINYGGRDDIVQAAQKVVEQGLPLTEQNIASHLYNAFIPDPEVVIRTGGHKRLSNFLLFQSAYSELYFTDTLWPDFTPQQFDAVVQKFCGEQRNFGGVKED